MRRDVACDANATNSSMVALHGQEAAAMRWMFDRAVGGSAGASLSFVAALQLLHTLRSAWRVHKLDVQFHSLSRACDSIDRDVHLTLPELVWIIRNLDPEHFKRAILIFEAERELNRVLAEARGSGRTAAICRAPVLHGPPLAAIEETRGKRWRYYTAFPCASRGPGSRGEVCLTFKPSVSSTFMCGLRLGHGGVRFVNGSFERRLIGFPWDERMFVHNVATLQLPGDRFVMVGGMQGFTSFGAGCRRGAHRKKRAKCLRPVEMPRRNASVVRALRGRDAVIAGVRITRGTGWK
eukprot:3802084-Prymnesium_polylepis.1